MNCKSMSEESGIVIVGGGICGLATALSLHRKGIKSIVIEKAPGLRTGGGGLSIQQNAWRALDQLGVGHLLRPKAIALVSGRYISSSNGSLIKEESFKDTEYRCIKRGDLIETIAASLPSDTIHFGCEIAKIESDPITSRTILHLQDGAVIKAKVVIGCDGVNSVVADWLGVKPTKRFNLCGVEGFTNYPDGHGLGSEFLRIMGDNIFFGRIPITEKQIYWFLARTRTPQDALVSKEPKLRRDSTLELVKDFPEGIAEVVAKCDLDSVTFSSLRHREPWDILVESFRKGTVTVAGDAMHSMGPFLGQGAAAALEDAVVLGRCLAQEMAMNQTTPGLYSKRSNEDSWEWKKRQDEEEKAMLKRIEKAIDRYVKERRMRILRLSIEAYLLATMLQTKSSVTKFMTFIIVVIFSIIVAKHTSYDCGRL